MRFLETRIAELLFDGLSLYPSINPSFHQLIMVWSLTSSISAASLVDSVVLVISQIYQILQVLSMAGGKLVGFIPGRACHASRGGLCPGSPVETGVFPNPNAKPTVNRSLYPSRHEVRAARLEKFF